MTENLPPLQRDREAFEAEFPPPSGVTWVWDRYEVSESRLDSYRCDRFVGQWDAWKARAAIDAALAARGAVPAGWVMLRTSNNEILVQAPNADPGGMTLPTGPGGSLSTRILEALCRDLLAVAPQQVAQPSKHGQGLTQQEVQDFLAQFDEARESIAQWPEWMRNAFGARSAAPLPVAQAKPEQAAQQWRPIETAPKDGYFLVHEDGATRALLRVDGAWHKPGYPALIDPTWGDVLVGDDAKRMLPTGYRLEIRDGCCDEPTHWMPLPAAPQKPKD